MLLRLSPLLTAVAFSILVLVGFALNKAIGTIRPIYRARSKLNAEVNARLNESLAGVRVVKGYHAEEREEQVFGRNVQRLLENILKTLTATSVMSLASTMILGVVSGLIIFLGAHRILNGSMTIGSFVTFSAFLALLIAPVLQIVGIGSQLTEGLAGLERTQEIMAESREDADPRRRVILGPIRGEVVFDHVDFAYTPGKTVLRDVSLRADPGTVTALVGPSGAGKSTIIGLIAAFYTPSSGKVLADGVDLSTVQLSSFRNQLGVVLQETFLFDGTIRENVAFSRPGAAEEEIMEACRVARVDEFAEAFELKYDTVVGERGVRLSGGQRQRVSIARALLADPRILILDEATSSLDSESEAMIQQGLAVLMRGRTTFVIAHRLSTIRRADQILVVEEGRIIERGNHASLYALGGRYFELYTRQHGLETNLFLAPGEGQHNLDAPVETVSGSSPADAAESNGADGNSPRLGERVRMLPKQDA
jgi:subfamily B ATP-binding cassette protein MsbA